MIRRIDDLGRTSIPKEVRKNLGINEGDPLEICVEGELVIFKKYEPGCIFCRGCKDVVDYKGKHICKSCLKEIKGA